MSNIYFLPFLFLARNSVFSPEYGTSDDSWSGKGEERDGVGGEDAKEKDVAELSPARHNHRHLVVDNEDRKNFKCKNDSDGGEEEGKESPGVEPGDGARLNLDAGVLKVV